MTGRKHACDLQLLGRYADQETTPEETRRMQTHLQSCLQCRQALADQHRLAELLKIEVSAAHQAVDHDRLEKRILSAARRPSGPERIRKNLWPWKILLPAATAAAVFMFVFVPLLQPPKPSGPSAIINSFTGRVSSVMILETPRSQQTVIWYSEEAPTDHATEGLQDI